MARITLSAGHMTGGFAPSQDIVIHTGKIIVDQGSGVDHLQRHRHRAKSLFLGAEERTCGEAEERADSLASGQKGIFHRFHKPGRDSLFPGIGAAFSEPSLYKPGPSVQRFSQCLKVTGHY
jgi:hypothetical protein